MKKLLCYICLAFFSFQVVPVKEIGQLLFEGQLLEEEVHTSSSQNSDQTKLKLKKDTDYYDALQQNNSRIACLNQQLNIAILLAEQLPLPFIADIVTPPPNRLT